MNGRKGNIYSVTSPVKRVQETAQHIISEIPEIDISKARILNLLAGPSFGSFKKLLNTKMNEGLSLQQVCEMFWDNKLEVKPEMVTKDYINALGMIFKNSIRKNRKISIIAYRHGDKDSAGNLSEKGIEQAKNLGKNLKKDLDKSEEELTILAATHNVINETVIHYIFSNEKLPEKWNSLLEFTESVKYTFYPQEGDKKPYLEVDWRGVQKQISYEDFQKLMENFNNPSSEEPSKLQE